jgi:DNA polymerase-3 subunit delta'
MVGADGVVPLPWLAGVVREQATSAQGHALLLHGPRGVGQLEAALALAQWWLCEQPGREPGRSCGSCAGCRLVQARTHPDLLVLLPEDLREALEWPLDGDDQRDDDGKRKASREIRVAEVRLAVGFAQRTASRGGARVIVLHPAEAMNAIAANALLKTLEEPPPALRFVLAAASLDELPPTVRSRCQPWRLALPPADEAASWLAGQGVKDAGALLTACGGEPLTALAWSRDGIEAATWLGLGDAVRRGDASSIAGWPVPRAVEALMKLCHDSAAVTLGAGPRWLQPAALRPVRELSALLAWQRELERVRRYVDHPWHAPLLIETLVTQGRTALA